MATVSLRSLLVAFTLAAVGAAAFANADKVWAAAMIWLTLTAIAVALLRALILGRSAPFSVGFSGIGILYLVFVWADPGSQNQGYRSLLPSQIFLQEAIEEARKFDSYVEYATSPNYYRVRSYFHRYWIGQSLACLIFASVGGMGAMCLAERAKRSEAKTPVRQNDAHA